MTSGSVVRGEGAGEGKERSSFTNRERSEAMKPIGD